jgi:hypothetical protein
MTVTTAKKQAAPPPEQDDKPVASPPLTKVRIHLADGNKGGVGKSMLARTLYQYFLDQGMPVLGVEADVDSPDFKGIYKEAAVSRFSEDENLAEQANNIVNWAIEERKNIVVNLPATVHKPFSTWLNHYNILTLLKTADIELVKWFVCTGEYDSMKSLGISLKTFGSGVRHVIVRNQKYGDWSFFDQDEEVQALIKQYDCPVMDLPKLPLQIASRMLQQRLTFTEAQQYRGQGFGIVQQTAVQGFLAQAYVGFEATGLVL